MLAAEEFRQGDEVAKALAHLLTVDGDHVVVNPVVHALSATGSYILGNLAFVVREHQVHSAAMDVEHFAKVFFSHHGALQVPAGETVAPG